MTVSNIPSTLDTLFQQDTGKTEQTEDPLGKDAFLKMLIAQVEHQDPLNPMQGTDFSAQLAEFSSLEQLFNINENLETMASAADGSGQDNVLDYIDKQVMIEDSTLGLSDGSITGGLYTLEDPVDVEIGIYDDIGREIMTLHPGTQSAGTYQVEWNGYDRTGTKVPDGAYRFELWEISDSGSYLPLKAAASGTVTGVSYESGIPFLEVDGQRVSPDKVVKVWGTSDTQEG